MDVLGDVARVVVPHAPDLDPSPAVLSEQRTVDGTTDDIATPRRFLFKLIKICAQIIPRHPERRMGTQKELRQTSPGG